MPRNQIRSLAATLVLMAVLSPAAASGAGKAPPKKAKKAAKARDYSRTLAVLKTSQGDITLRFFVDRAPNHVKAFVDLAAKGFYDQTLFHRVIPDFMIQGGDPLTRDPAKAAVWGTGGANDSKGRPVTIKAEFNDLTHKRGVLSMARASDPDSASSQFFVVVKDSPFLDRQYTVFGEVVSGLEVCDKIVAESRPDISDPRTGGRPTSYQKILKVELQESAEPAPVVADAAGEPGTRPRRRPDPFRPPGRSPGAVSPRRGRGAETLFPDRKPRPGSRPRRLPRGTLRGPASDGRPSGRLSRTRASGSPASSTTRPTSGPR